MQPELGDGGPNDDGAVTCGVFPVVRVVPFGRDSRPERFAGRACGLIADPYLCVGIFSHPAPERPKGTGQTMFGLHQLIDFDVLYACGNQLVDLRHKRQHLGPCIAPILSRHHSASIQPPAMAEAVKDAVTVNPVTETACGLSICAPSHRDEDGLR